MQPSAEERWWWIDAICINQHDLIEKAAQVGRMSVIYQAASKVVVWLGPEYDASDRAMDLIQELVDLDFGDPELTGVHSSFQVDIITDTSLWLHRDQYSIFSEYEKRYSKEISDNDLQMYHSLVHRPWWKRAWVVQEVSSSIRRITEVWCGSKLSNLVDILLADLKLQSSGLFVLCVPEAPITFMLHNDPVQVLATIRLNRRDPQEFGYIQSLKLLQDLIAYRATDPRDKVFAFISMFDSA